MGVIFAFVGCFEVPPLPDSVPGCGGLEACAVDEVCRNDGLCAPDDEVFLELACRGVATTFIAYGCGDRSADFLSCTGNQAFKFVTCPVNTPVQVCCGQRADGLGPDAAFTDVVLQVDPADGWNCDGPVPAEIDGQCCVHSGFAISPEDVAAFDCETSFSVVPGLGQ